MTTAAPKSAARIPRLLTGQKALVTGVMVGIGQAVGVPGGQAGADGVVNYVAGEGRAQEVVRAIAQHGVKAYAHLADVSDETQVQDMFSGMVQRLGTIDILVNNAGLQRDAAFEEMTLKQWNAVISVNLTGQFLCARAAIGEFLRRGVRPEVSSSAGKIICMSSVHQEIPWAGHCNYAASKGGIMMLMKSIAQEFAPHRIRINSIAPGAASASCSWNAGTFCRVNEKIGIPPPSSSTPSIRRKRPGTARMAACSIPGSTIGWAAIPRCTARRCFACAGKISARSNIMAGDPRLGRSPMRISSPTIAKPSTSTRCMASTGSTRPTRRQAGLIRTRRSRTSRASRNSTMPL